MNNGIITFSTDLYVENIYKFIFFPETAYNDQNSTLCLVEFQKQNVKHRMSPYVNSTRLFAMEFSNI